MTTFWRCWSTESSVEDRGPPPGVAEVVPLGAPVDTVVFDPDGGVRVGGVFERPDWVATTMAMIRTARRAKAPARRRRGSVLNHTYPRRAHEACSPAAGVGPPGVGPPGVGPAG